MSSQLLPLLQAEYQALKQEQAIRIGIRDNALYVNFIGVGYVAVIAFGQEPPRLLLLLIVPLISCCVYALYLNHDIMVSNLRRFFAEEFPKRVVASFEPSGVEDISAQVANVLGSWESFHRSISAYRRPRKLLNTGFLLLNFLGTSIAALFATAEVVMRSGTWPLVLWVFDLVIVIGLAIVLAITSDI